MTLEFLVNPRSAPRARVRCQVTAVGAGVTLEGHTEDVGPHGCQLVSSRPVPKGTLLHLVLRAPSARDPLDLAGTVAWASPNTPWRLGVAFAEGARPAAGRFFDALVAAQPGLAAWRQVPERISLDAMVWLAPPPRLVVDFNADEVRVLTAIGTGATVFELKSRLRERWAISERAFFSLLAGHYLTLSRGGAVPFANWAALLRQLQAEVAADSLSESAPPEAPPRPAPPPRAAAAPPPPRPASPGTRPQPPWAGDASTGLDLDPEALELDVAPAAAAATRRARPAEAEEAWQQALQELAAGRTQSGAALLRAAMALAPGDPEIAKKFGEVSAGRR